MAFDCNSTPRKFFAGDSLVFTASNPSELVGVTSCEWVLSSATAVAFAGVVTQDGLGFTFTIPAANSQLVPGSWTSTLVYSLAGGGRVSVSQTPCVVLADPTQPHVLSVLEVALAEAETTIQKLSAALMSSTSTNGVSSTKKSLAEAWSNRNSLFVAVDAERRRKGLPGNGSTKIRQHRGRFA